MVFTSLTFTVFFLPLVILLFFICKNIVLRNAVLLVFSLLFYAWGEPKWIIVMLISIILNYCCALLIGYARSALLRRVWLLAGISASLIFLLYFKYFSFLAGSVMSLLQLDIEIPKQLLPIGISFYTFQILTYTIDVYQKKVEPQKNLFKLMLYISFFPQLIAGPIVNYTNIHTFLSKRRIDADGLYYGMLRFMTGFSKKILLANICGEVLNGIVSLEGYSFAGAWLMAISFALQIYFDFSGYSDMAIGMGQIFGFKFKENFNYPYISSSISEFWRRWHISLGTFFRDYIYIPLGGNRVSRLRLIFNLLIVWGLTGLWHGASWNFLLWGLYYGVLLIIEKLLFSKLHLSLPCLVKTLITLILVIVGWVIFYHEDLSLAGTQLQAMFLIKPTAVTDSAAVYYFKQYFGFLLFSVLACIPWLQTPVVRRLGALPAISRCASYIKPIIVTLIFTISLSFLIGQSYNPFLYFRF